MLGNQSNGNCNKPVFRNARLFGPNCTIGNGSNNSNNNSKSAATATNNGSKNQTTEHQSDFIEEDFNEYSKTDIPEMKLLPMEYVGKVKSKPKPKCPPPPPPVKNIKCKCPASNLSDGKPAGKSALKVTINAPESAKEKASTKLSDKYLVYKQKHSIFGTSKDILNGKLKYVSDNDKSSVDAAIQDAQKSKEGRKKYLIFDSKKNNSSKFETIQYYFDNKSYEKYVDTKLYGRLNQISNPQPILKKNNSNSNGNRNIDDDDDDDDEIDDIDLNSDIDMRGFENSRSWEYRDNAKTESKLKLFESKQKKQETSKKSQFRSSKSEGSCSGNISGASSCSEVLLKRQNCRLKPQQKQTLSKSIGDLTAINKSSKTNHDVKRINQLFENAKQNQVTIASALKSNVDNIEKYKIHKVVRDDSNVVGDRGNLCRENVKKYHRSSTDLSIKSPVSKPSSCGFKNCKLSNCPISHHTNHNSPPIPSVPIGNDRRSKFDENFIKKFEDMMKNSSSTNSNNNNNCILRNNEITVNKTNISVNGKSNIIVNDTKNNFLPPSSCHDVLIINSDCSSTNHEKEVHSKANNNNNNKTTIKINDSCFVVNNSNDVKYNNNEKYENKNIIELNSEKVMTPTNWDKNMKVKNNPQPKFNNKIDVNNKIKNEENSVKIYVIGNDSASSPTPSAAFSTISSTSPDTSSSSDSDKDDGYYDASSQGRSSSPEFSEMFKKLRDMCNANNKQVKKQPNVKFGYDGTLFWNNSYFDEDETDFMLTAMNNNNKSSISRKNEKISSSSSTYACTKCHTTTEDLLSNYICICRNKVDNYITRPLSCEGPSDSGVSVSSENIFSPDGDNTSLTAQSQTDYESRKVRQKHVLTELLETERIYVNEMRSILTGYKDKLLSEEMQSMVPAGLQGNADILFGNLQEIYTFHSDVFLKDLENSICLTELVALCFVQRRDVFFRLYSYYCQNIPRSERLRETLVDTHLFLSECQKKLGHKLPLAAYLLKPVQRITKYQLLLKDLLKFSDSGTCTKELQKALDCMLVVLKCVNDSMHQIAITGFPADLSQQGDLLLQDSFQICSENKKDIKLRIKPQQRHVFLYQKAILFCKQDTKTGHNKSTYQFKHWLKMSQIGLTESVRGDVKKFEVWLQGRSEVHTFQAATIEIKGKWVSEIKRVLMNQLEELKDEKIKQYGNHVNHRPLKQSNSGSYEVPSMNINQRAMSVESTPENAKQRNITPPITVADDANNTWNSTGISASSSEHDNHETNAWSSDCSNSEDDNTFLEENAVPGTKFIALADYNAMGNSEVSLKEGATVELRKLGCAGWVFVKKLDDETEGWVPCAFLQSTGSMESSIKKSSKHKHRT